MTMKKLERKKAIQTVYEKMWEVLGLYEKTNHYNEIPYGEIGKDIWDYMGEKMLAVRKSIETLTLGNPSLEQKLTRIADELELFLRAYSVPGVVDRWSKINPKILYFDCAYDFIEEEPELYEMIQAGTFEFHLNCYPDQADIAARKSYFSAIEAKCKEGNLRYSEDKILQDELHNTLSLVFEHDFEKHL